MLYSSLKKNGKNIPERCEREGSHFLHNLLSLQQTDSGIRSTSEDLVVPENTRQPAAPVLNDIRVLHVSCSRHWHGGERQLSYLLRMLTLHVKHEVICIAGSRLAHFCYEHDIPCHTYRGGLFRQLNLLNTLRNVHQQQYYHLIHCHDRYAQSAAWLSMINRPVIVNRRASHDLKPDVLNRLKFRSQRLKRIICPSHFVAYETERIIGHQGLTTVIHSSIDTEAFHPDMNQQRLHEELRLPEQVRIIGTAGVIRSRKNLKLFVRTARHLLKEFRDLHFVIIGEGPDAGYIADLIFSYGLSDRISMLGFRQDIATLLPELDLFLLTPNSEGFSTALLEAFASGVPVVASAVGGIREIIEDDISGILVEPEDPDGFTQACRKLLESARDCERLSIMARTMTDRFDARKMAEAYHRVYLEVTRHN